MSATKRILQNQETEKDLIASLIKEATGMNSDAEGLINKAEAFIELAEHLSQKLAIDPHEVADF